MHLLSLDTIRSYRGEASGPATCSARPVWPTRVSSSRLQESRPSRPLAAT